jgi:hypothetical protein
MDELFISRAFTCLPLRRLLGSWEDRVLCSIRRTEYCVLSGGQSIVFYLEDRALCSIRRTEHCVLSGGQSIVFYLEDRALCSIRRTEYCVLSGGQIIVFYPEDRALCSIRRTEYCVLSGGQSIVFCPDKVKATATTELAYTWSKLVILEQSNSTYFSLGSYFLFTSLLLSSLSLVDLSMYRYIDVSIYRSTLSLYMFFHSFHVTKKRTYIHTHAYYKCIHAYANNTFMCLHHLYEEWNLVSPVKTRPHVQTLLIWKLLVLAVIAAS